MPGRGKVSFPGHPTLGTAYFIQHQIIKIPAGTIVLNLKVGQIPVNLNDKRGVLWMKQMLLTFGVVFDAGIVSDVLNIDASD